MKMKITKIKTIAELNSRVEKVFDLKETEAVFNAFVEKGGQLVIVIEDCGADSEWDTITHEYRPNMKDRPQALAYIMGERNNFND